MTARGTSERFYLASAALGGRRQPVDIYLPPGYRTHPLRRYPVLYLLHGVPGRPGAFLATVRAGVVEDELVAQHKLRPMILAMPFGSTGSFTDEEWANGVQPKSAWETFLARDVVRAVDARYRTIPSGGARALAGLSEGGYGALQHRPAPPGRVSRARELVGLRARRRHRLGIRSSGRDCLRRNSPALTLRGAAPALRRAHTFLWFYSGTDDKFRTQNATFAKALGEPRPAAPILPRPRRPQLGALARQRGEGAPGCLTEARCYVERARFPCCSRSRSRRAAGSTWCVSRAARRSATRCPLDELSRHASTPLLWFVAVWGAAGLLLGALRTLGANRANDRCARARSRRRARSTYLQTGVAIAVVRQISVRDALDLASRRQAVYTPAVLVAVAAAVLAPRRRVGRRAPFVVATVVAAGALLNILHAVLPGDDAGLLHSLTPDAVGPLAHAAGVLVAVALLVAARGLARRRRRAWQVATTLGILATALHALHGFNHGSLASAVVLALLLARRHDFDRPGDAATRRLLLERLAIAVPAIARLRLRGALAEPDGGRPAVLASTSSLDETLRGVFARDVGGSPHLRRRVRRLVPALAPDARHGLDGMDRERLARARGVTA